MRHWKMAASGRLLLFAGLFVICYSAPGGFKTLDTADDEVIRLAKSAAAEISTRSNSVYAQKLVKVTRARQQVQLSSTSTE